VTRSDDGLRYAITPGPDGPASSLDYFTIDSLGRPQPPTAKVIVEFQAAEWSVDLVVDYEFENKMNGRSAHIGVAFGEPAQLYRDGIVVTMVLRQFGQPVTGSLVTIARPHSHVRW
jgi:hypothetical protein